MGKVSVEAVLAMPRAQVWDRLRDLRLARHYVLGVTQIEFNPGPREGVGASRKVFMKGRAPVDETAVEWLEQRGYTLKIHNGEQGPKPFKSASFQYELADAANNQTHFRGTFAYEMGGGVFGWLLERLLIRAAVARSNAALGINMKTFYETGKTTNPALVRV